MAENIAAISQQPIKSTRVIYLIYKSESNQQKLPVWGIHACFFLFPFIDSFSPKLFYQTNKQTQKPYYFEREKKSDASIELVFVSAKNMHSFIQIQNNRELGRKTL